jgi:hypothetical protein
MLSRIRLQTLGFTTRLLRTMTPAMIAKMSPIAKRILASGATDAGLPLRFAT